MQVTARKQLLIAWFLIGSLAAAVCSLIWPAAHFDGEVIPVGNDSFYHARRILDTAANPSAFYEFDTKIHAPEGSLLVWPWGYDYGMAWIVRIGMHLGLAEQPIEILVWIPVAAVFLTIGLILLLATELGMSLWASSLVALCVALSPLTQYLHGVGFVDHHFAEYIFVLTTLLFGLRWLKDMANRRAAIHLGIVLGIAPAIHNALFVLQIPVLAALLILWVQGIRAPQRSAIAFCVALLASTLAILVPSLPFRQGIFEFYLLSWFQLYVAGGTAVCCMLFAYRGPDRKGVAFLGGFAALSLLPLLYQISMAGMFLSGKLTRLNVIGEMMSMKSQFVNNGPLDISDKYSLFLWLVPITICYCLYKTWQDRSNGRVLIWLWSVCGLIMLLMQFRLHYYGSFALYLPWLALADKLASRPGATRNNLLLATTLLVLLAYAPPMRNQLLGPMPVANDLFYPNFLPLLKALAKSCDKDPGVVLADHDIGHHIRYFTNCSVIADNFILTDQQVAKIDQMNDLLETHAKDLINKAPFVKYVLVRPALAQLSKRGMIYMSYDTGAGVLLDDLLLHPTAPTPIAPPQEYTLLFESRMKSDEGVFPYARLYKIQRTTPALVNAAAPSGH